MILKRVAAALAALLLFVQLTACKPQSTEGFSGSSIYTQSAGGSYTEDGSSSGGSGNTVSLPQDYDRNDFPSGTVSSGSLGTNTSRPTNNINSGSAEGVGGSQDGDRYDNTSSSSQGSNIGASVSCKHDGGDPYQNVNKTQFYADYEVACCNLDASYRSKHGLLSGSVSVPGQYAQESQNRPSSNGKYARNTSAVYLDGGNTYVVVDSDGDEVMRVHKAGGYITLEEVAAYMYAFGGNGTIPANYTSKKSGKPSSSIWGEYLRVNHSYFSGDTDKYPYEPELPNISGCGGSLRYYEMDIGTTGTATPGYPAAPYIQGNKITRGAARIVYARQDLNGNGVYETNELYLFYTHNHYNDFREYLNYYGGWGEMFGNVTGGGEYSDKNNARPTPYVPTTYWEFVRQ